MTDADRRFMDLSLLLAQERTDPSPDLSRRIFDLRREMERHNETGTFWARPQAR